MGTYSRWATGRQPRLMLTPQCLHFSTFIRVWAGKVPPSRSAQRPRYLMFRWVNKDVSARWIIKLTPRLNTHSSISESWGNGTTAAPTDFIRLLLSSSNDSCENSRNWDRHLLSLTLDGRRAERRPTGIVQTKNKAGGILASASQHMSQLI